MKANTEYTPEEFEIVKTGRRVLSKCSTAANALEIAMVEYPLTDEIERDLDTAQSAIYKAMSSVRHYLESI